MTSSPESPPPDQDQREAALHPLQSFIVQAPAGSGKTELLIRRLLKLLTAVDAPEQIVAITFTRKAASEMRQRLLDALDQAARPDQVWSDAPPLSTKALARDTLAHDRRMGWGLLDNPSRLRVQTIDALCAGLCRRMPLVSGRAAGLSGTDDAQEMYREAARRTLRLLVEGSEWQAPLQRLLAHIDNDMTAAERLFVRMLECRDHWLRHVADPKSPTLDRCILEAALRGLIEDHLSRLSTLFPVECAGELSRLARYAAGNLRRDGSESAISLLEDIERMPGAMAKDAHAWYALATLLLNIDGVPRTRLDKTIGFISPKSGEAKAEADVWKARMRTVLDRLRQDDMLIQALHGVRQLPPPNYKEQQWEGLDALLRVLPVLAAQLTLVFDEYQRVDHAAVMRAALDALGRDEAPSDLALALDYRIQHILVDEFQDTSHGQYQLIERLTAGWGGDDGRTLFLVGDPMQSIYRFREADVSLYLRARENGIANLRLRSIVLKANFRASAAVVRWINEHFAHLLPAHDDMESGAVSYSPCVAVLPEGPPSTVTVGAVTQGDRTAEADEVLRLVGEAQRVDPRGSIAILVSSRAHLKEVLPRLRAAGLTLSASDIEPLEDRPVVRDLFALTCALQHPADRVAWFSVLRAPWCGLSLADLELIAQASDTNACTIPYALQNSTDWLSQISKDGSACLKRVLPTLLGALANRGRVGVRRWVEGAWIALGGPATAQRPPDLEDAGVYLDLLAALDEGAGRVEPERLRGRMAKLYARSESAERGAVQIMTIHGAKGLEFDTVIVPGLGNGPAKEPQQILRWLERGRPGGGGELLLAILGEGRRSDDDAYAALARIEKVRSDHELIRLIYVAATRARRVLHLIGTLREGNAESAQEPLASSLLSRLWSVVRGEARLIQGQGKSDSSTEFKITSPLRLPLDWRIAAPPPPCHLPAPVRLRQDPIEFSWASNTARALGVSVHRALQSIAVDGPARWPDQRVATLSTRVRSDLRHQGVGDGTIERAAESVLNTIRNVLRDQVGRWILDAHDDAASELRLTAYLDGDFVSVAMDRTFVANDGRRWIIDFKTGAHEGTALQDFLDREQTRYAGQMLRYARIFRLYGESREIRLALYFPQLQAWRHWPSPV